MIFFGILLGVLMLGYLALLGIILIRQVRPLVPKVPPAPPQPSSEPLEPGEVILELRSVYKAFDRPVLNDISFLLRQGETLGILGKSGSGKSVTLKLIAGLMRPDHGRILFRGQHITILGEEKLLELRKKVSYVFQGGAVFDFLTVRENIAYPLRELGWKDEEEIQARVDYLLEAVELDNMGDLSPSDLSIGSRKQTAIARAIAIQPEIILYDEPTTNLDPIIGKSISRLIRKLDQQEHLTSVVVTHDLKCIEIVADRVILLKDGGIHFEGDLAAFQASPDPYVRAFIAGTRYVEAPAG